MVAKNNNNDRPGIANPYVSSNPGAPKRPSDAGFESKKFSSDDKYFKDIDPSGWESPTTHD
jgi:hypothetical protein